MTEAEIDAMFAAVRAEFPEPVPYPHWVKHTAEELLANPRNEAVVLLHPDDMAELRKRDPGPSFSPGMIRLVGVEVRESLLAAPGTPLVVPRALVQP